MQLEGITTPEQQYYILATESPARERTLVLKEGETFAVFNDFGDVDADARHEEGLYHEGTRFLSRMTLLLAHDRPLLLSSTVRRDNVVLAADLTNPDIYYEGQVILPRGTLHIYRSKFLWHGVCYERIHIRNYALSAVDIGLSIGFAADYADVFEVRGQKRPLRGRLIEPQASSNGIELGYEGLDGITRRTFVECSPPPALVSGSEMHILLHLPSRGVHNLLLNVTCETAASKPKAALYDTALAEAERSVVQAERLQSAVETNNRQFDAWLQRSIADLNMMLTSTPYGLYPYAGVPWFDTAFGRDGIITALQTLWIAPAIARGVLLYLAATQADEFSDERDCEPGKILHETRKGEMAALGEVPFGRYYGSIDSTPLFVMLAGAYYQRTGDIAFIESIWPNIERALEWIDRYGDIDRDHRVEYHRRSPRGLVQQGWKDSHDSIFHADGNLADGPIAVCEVQGYVYAASLAAAEIATALGHADRSAALIEAARLLKERFEESFWCDDIGTYALALDGAKRPCRVRSSNPGHCLYSGIAGQERGRAVADGFATEKFFSGWGVRTVADGEVRFNPMSYHNGSIWPHDNSLVAAGAARYGQRDLAARILTGMLDASTFFDLHRLPELFCGFSRRSGKAPTAYPVACSPQAWASGAVFLLLQSCLGMTVDAVRMRVVFSHPTLPECLEHIRIRNLAVGKASIDFALSRHAGAVGVHVEHRKGQVEVFTID
jgi:glycogen debranching enzyme